MLSWWHDKWIWMHVRAENWYSLCMFCGEFSFWNLVKSLIFVKLVKGISWYDMGLLFYCLENGLIHYLICLLLILCNLTLFHIQQLHWKHLDKNEKILCKWIRAHCFQKTSAVDVANICVCIWESDDMWKQFKLLPPGNNSAADEFVKGLKNLKKELTRNPCCKRRNFPLWSKSLFNELFFLKK